MTLEELSEKTGISVSTLKSQFKREQKTLYAKGILITKEGRGDKAVYGYQVMEDHRAETMFATERDNLLLSTTSLKYPNWEFLIFLAVITTPMLVFRGTIAEFLSYVKVNDNTNNRQAFKNAIQKLNDDKVLLVNIDDSAKTEVYIISIYKKVEEEQKIGIDMVRQCKALQVKYNKRDWIPLLKTWLAVEIMSKNQPYTQKDLMEITGLSAYTIRECDKILCEDRLYVTKRAYIREENDEDTFFRCAGKNVTLNAYIPNPADF